ncbi:hypothetical protein RD792_009280 [Penstemon davidsonii]|uniref:CP12 domain-containing protein n=1 Tax=Penstemon davidsonii TaxID=160366 RepID=A0ABR0CYK6_9LAMI|nr:hypothetical protein RD792_009280 [Penstemon davidsonii]
MASLTGITITTPKPFTKPSESPKPFTKFSILNSPWKRSNAQFRIAAAPDQISGKVEESIKNAQETCSEDPVSGECAAAWDEVEELSAAASHARDLKKDTDPLETYCKDNPETDECRTYDN